MLRPQSQTTGAKNSLQAGQILDEFDANGLVPGQSINSVPCEWQL